MTISSYSPEAALFLANRVDFDYADIPAPDTREGELEWLASYKFDKYDATLTKDSIVFTGDAVVFTVTEGVLKVLLIQRGNHPFKGFWCLPGGFVNPGEDAVAAVKRELEEETGLTGISPRFIEVASSPWRDPRMRNVCAYVCSVLLEGEEAVEGMDDAVDAAWVPALDVLTGAIPVGFDHYRSIQKAIIQEFTA